MFDEEKGVGQAEPAPLSKRWLFAFYFKHEERMSSYEKSIIDNALCTYDYMHATLKDTDASEKLKNATYVIINKMLT